MRKGQAKMGVQTLSLVDTLEQARTIPESPQGSQSRYQPITHHFEFYK